MTDKCKTFVARWDHAMCSTCGEEHDRPAPTPTPAPGLDLDAAEKRAAGFRGRFRVVAYDSGEELLEFVSADCDPGDDVSDIDEIAQFACDDETQRAIVDTLNAAPALIAEVRALRAAAEEREADMHARIRAGYDKTVADAWRAEVAKRDAEIADLRALVESQRRDYLDVRLTAELAAARAVPADVEAAILTLVGVTICETSRPPHSADNPSPPMDVARNALRTAIARAISDATAMPLVGEWALVAAMRDATAQLAVNNDPSSINRGRCDEWANRVAAAVPGATAVWLDSIIDADDFPIDAQPRVGHCVVEYAGRWYDSERPLGVDDVGLLAGLDRGALATAARGTVGGLLATEPVVEYQVDLGRGPRWRQTRHGRTRTWLGSSPVGMSWTEWNTGSDDVDEYAARLVPAAEADRDPATRSPLLAAAPNLHPDGCHTADPTAPRDCTSDGHHECTSCARFDAAGRAAMGDDPIGGPRGPLPKGG